MNQFRFPFDAQSSIVTKIEPCDPVTEPMYLEPPGFTPFLVFCDESLNPPNKSKLTEGAVPRLNPDWNPSKQLVEQQRIDWVRTQSKLLSQVRSKIASGVYSLGKWRLECRDQMRKTGGSSLRGDALKR